MPQKVTQAYKEFVFKGVNVYYVGYVCKTDGVGPDICSVTMYLNRGLPTEKKVGAFANPQFVSDLQTQVLQPWLANGSIPNPTYYNYLLGIEGVSTADFNSLNNFLNSAKAQGCFA